MTTHSTLPPRPVAEQFLFDIDGRLNEIRDLLVVADLALTREVTHCPGEDIDWASINAISRIVSNAREIIEGIDEDFKSTFEALREERAAAERRAA